MPTNPWWHVKGDASSGPATEFRTSIKICASWLAGQSCVRMNTMWKPQLVNYLISWKQMAFDVSSRKAGDWDLLVTARTLKPKSFWKLQALHWITSSWKLRKSKTDVAEAHTLILCDFEVAILRFNGSMQWPQNCSCSSMKKGQATSKHPRSMVRAHTARCLGMQPPCLNNFSTSNYW